MTAGAPLFQSLEVETASRCNLRCPTCPVALRPRPETLLPEATFLRLLDEMASIGYAGAFSPHFFNEPLADPRLPELLGEVARRLPAARMVVFTNVTLMTPELLARMPATVHEYVVTIDNPVIARAYARLMEALAPEQRARFRARSIAQDALNNRAGSVDLGRDLRKVGRCRLVDSYCVVNAWGEVLLCYNDYEARHVFGNINTEPLLEIWNRPAFVAARRAAAAGEHEGLICSNCACNAPQEEVG